MDIETFAAVNALGKKTKSYARRITYVLSSRTWTARNPGVLFIRTGGCGGNGTGGSGPNGGTVGVRMVKVDADATFTIVIPAAGSRTALTVTGPDAAITVPAGSDGVAVGAGQPPPNPVPTGLDWYILGGLGGAASRNTGVNGAVYGGGGAAAMLGVSYNGGSATATSNPNSVNVYGGGAGVGGKGADANMTGGATALVAAGGGSGAAAWKPSTTDFFGSFFDNREDCVLLVPCLGASVTTNTSAGPGAGGGGGYSGDGGFGAGAGSSANNPSMTYHGGICGGGSGVSGSKGGQGMVTLEFFEELLK